MPANKHTSSTFTLRACARDCFRASISARSCATSSSCRASAAAAAAMRRALKWHSCAHAHVVSWHQAVRRTRRAVMSDRPATCAALASIHDVASRSPQPVCVAAVVEAAVVTSQRLSQQDCGMKARWRKVRLVSWRDAVAPFCRQRHCIHPVSGVGETADSYEPAVYMEEDLRDVSASNSAFRSRNRLLSFAMRCQHRVQCLRHAE